MKALVLVALVGCSISDLDYTGKACPCPTGYSCDQASQTCTKHPKDIDGAVDVPTEDSTMDASCLSNMTTPYATEAYASPTFADFQSDWMTGGGMWSTSGTEVVQTSTAASLSFIQHPIVGPSNYRIVAKMRTTSMGSGFAIEIAARIDLVQSRMYHCNWEPDGGAFILQRTDGIMTAVIKETMVNTQTIPGYTIGMPVTMEFQISGASMYCCLRGIPAAQLSGSDSTYSAGQVGLKTYRMAGAFSDFHVYK